MSLSIEQIEQQISELQKTLEELKNPKLEIARQFTGHYFQPYQGVLYRRMESEGIPIWESYLEIKKEWTILSSQEMRKMEEIYSKDYITFPDEEDTKKE